MENNQRNSRKRLNSLILLVAFTAVMLIVSTYAWFSAQKNVTLGGLTGEVKVAEGLEISLDAKYWSQEVDFNNYSTEQLKKIYASGKTLRDNNLTATDAEHNLVPSELLPVSTTGKGAADPDDADGIGLADMRMYRGIVDDTTELYEIIQVQNKTDDLDNPTGRVYAASKYTADGSTETPIAATHHDYPGYYAIDFFLRNSTGEVSKTTQADGVSSFDKTNQLQLNSNSLLRLTSTSANSTGLQNTVRVAFALYNINEELADGVLPSGTSWNDHINGVTGANPVTKLTRSAYMTASQEQILAAYAGQTINDVAIWEPNASDHSQYVVDNNNVVSFSSADHTLYSIPAADDVDEGLVKNHYGLSHLIPTYALTKAATELVAGATTAAANTITVGTNTTTMVAGLKNLYNWDNTPSTGTMETGLDKQVTLQTEKSGSDNFAVGKVKNLISVKSDPSKKYQSGVTAEGATGFVIPKGKVCKLRMYVWLEGQDVDTINQASHGGGIYLDVGLLKDGVAES